MFFDRPDCTQLVSGIYVFKKYVPLEMCKRYTDILNTFDPADFNEEGNAIDWYDDKMSPPVPGIIDLWEHISELLYPDYVINPQAQVITSRVGHEGMFVHCDSPGKENADMLTQNDTYGTCSLIDYGVVAYLSEFEGGDVIYPAFLPDGTLKETEEIESIPEHLSYKPEPGDVVIHRSEAPYYHGTLPVTKGIRYAFSCFATQYDMAPGTFYNYKSEKYLHYVKDRSEESIGRWLQGDDYQP
jgi:hypothetical protein